MTSEKEIIEFFCEDPKKFKFNNFLKIFMDLSYAIKNCIRENYELKFKDTSQNKLAAEGLSRKSSKKADIKGFFKTFFTHLI